MSEDSLTMNSAVLVLHAQNDITHPDGKFAYSGIPEQVAKRGTWQKLSAFLDACRAAGIPVFYVNVSLRPGHPELSLKSYPIHAGGRDVQAWTDGSWGAEVVDELNGAGFNARGQVGDLDPLMAIGDGLAQFDASEIVVVANDDEHAEPGEEGLWERIEGEFHQPLTMIKVAPVPESEVPEIVSSQHAPARDKTDEEIVRETRNVPPFSRRDLLGILFGVIGTIALGWIAVLAASDDPRGSLSAASAAILLIAIGAFLINVAHVVGLVFFESVRYKGIWEKFMARMSIIVTSFGLVIALALLLLDEI